MYTIPHRVYVNRKRIRGFAVLLGSLSLFLAAAFCYSTGASGKNLLTLLVLPLCALWLAILTLARLALLRCREPLVVLEKEGIRFSGKLFEPIGTVAWKDITVCMDREMGWNNERHLLIHVRNPAAYSNRIPDPRLRRRFEKQSIRYNALLWIKTASLDEDIVELKRAVFRMKEPAGML